MTKHSIGTSVERRIVQATFLLGMLAAATGAQAQTVAQTPLSVAGRVPSNLILTPSVEWPTIDSVANIAAVYVPEDTYVGYFDSRKCYEYFYSAIETERHFYPVEVTGGDHDCDGDDKQWSGNFLNWAATQTIDPFRKALTGGYRTTDTASVTILEKARSDNNGGGSIFPDRNLSDEDIFTEAAPLDDDTWATFKTRQGTLGNRLRFTDTGDLSTVPTAYDPSVHELTDDPINRNTVYEVSVRVKVCVSGMLEDNCVAYGGNHKPEGLLQKYSEKMRFSVFGYLNDSAALRDGAPLRANQKFIGPQRLNPSTNELEANPNREWNANGTFVQNPDSADAATTSGVVGLPIENSGVINYLNKFGQMTTAQHKNWDPVSEMYYAAIRYVRNLGNVPEYTELAGDATMRYTLVDGFPVITEWEDPLQYSCQNTAILGIGDTNTWNDQNLSGALTRTLEPAMPAAVSADTVDVKAWLDRVAAIEGITIPTSPDFTGRNNSAYMVGLAYYAHTTDLRPEAEMPGRQSVATHWVDVREATILRPREENQYWLAAKYGGFIVPKDFDPITHTTSLPNNLWTQGDFLAPFYPRPENFYVASQASQMVDSLKRAFAKIYSDSTGSASSLAANSTRLDTSTLTFQAQFTSSWTGDLKAYEVAADGSLAAISEWTASATDSLSPTNWAARKIFFNQVPGAGLNEFTFANLSVAQKAMMGAGAAMQADVVDYIRGNQTKEEGNPGGIFRKRLGSLLGDIVNSTPVYVGKPNSMLYTGAMGFSGAASYAAFASAQASRPGIIWVGANDGMLHGFDATSGEEVYAFIPKSAIASNLASYADPDYEHKYFVDGDIAVADVYISGSWRTILVGTMGRGGPGVFALDVTDPTAASISLLWDKDDSDIPELGHNLGKPVIAQTANGVWHVLFGNGPDNGSGKAELIAINLQSGSVTTVDTGDGVALSAVLARDTNGDRFVDAVYAGDMEGRLLKFTGIPGSPSATTIFTAVSSGGTPQPITAAPQVGKDPATSLTWVFFGTGKYFSELDPATTSGQTWYGIQDDGTVPTRASLVEREITTFVSAGKPTLRTVSEGTSEEMSGMHGWYMDLPASRERMIVPNMFRGGALLGITRIPDSSNVCLPGGSGFVMAINPFTGARLDQTFFDINGDGVFDDGDKLSGTIVSGIGFDSSPNSPIFIENVMQVSLDDGSTKTIKTQSASMDARRLGWREIRN